MATEIRQDDGADRLGRGIANVFLVLLALLFVYGYLAPIFTR